MKKRFVSALLLAVFCLATQADVITPSQALSLAEDFLGESLTASHVRGMRGIQATADEKPAPLYIISRGDNQGWVVVSGDNSLPAIIGYTDAGDFDADNLSPAYRDMLDCVTAAVTAAQQAGASSRVQPVTADDGRRTISPLITSHWNQGSPWNLRCPVCSDNGERALTGCVATAASQVIYYFRKDLPATLQANTPTYKGDSEHCDVTEVIKKGTPLYYELLLDSYSGSEPDVFKQAVATICYAVGAAARLGYWHSTGGYISSANDAMRSHFGLGGTHLDRGDMALKKWEEIIYGSLQEKKPLLYSGFTTDQQSGHAINLDGYNATNGLWHFNFGWGGSGDGWYTLDLETGVNGFCIWQSIVYGITPTRQNLSASLSSDEVLYQRVYNTLTARITNNSTLSAKGFSLYLMNNEKSPSTSNTALATDNETVIAPGETAEITFRVRPSLARDYYAYVTDSRRIALDHVKVSVIAPSPALSLEALDVSASGDVVTAGGRTFRRLNASAATLSADISNDTEGTPGQPNVKFELYKWNPDTGKDTLSLHKNVSNTSFNPGERLTLSHTFKNLAAETYYIGRIRCDDLKIETPDSIVLFYVGEKSLAVDTIADGTAVLSGGWDPNLFAQLATDPAICAYDLTAVSGVTSNVADYCTVNPNALFYVKGDIAGRNIVADGQCADLALAPGYDFRPLAPFHAARATFTPDVTPAVWNTLTLPFACQRPDGWICRKVTAWSASYVSESVMADILQPSEAYLVMADSPASGTFTASDVDVAAAVDTALMSPFIGSYTAVRTYPLRHEGDTYILCLDTDPASTTQYFLKTDTTYILPPFQAVVSSTSKKVRATASNSLETAYKKLAAAIDEAQALYDKLQTLVTDSANLSMETLLTEARTTYYCMTEETTSNISALTRQLNSLCETYPLMIRRITQPVDYTSFLINPSFENNNKTGWKTDSYASVRSVTNLSTYGAYSDGKYLLYNSKANVSTAISQTVTGLPDGYYRVSAMLGTAEDGTINFYAGDQEVAVPASEYGKYYLTEAVIDSIRVEGGELTLGVRAGQTWYKADAFQLHLIGHLQGDDTAVKPLLQEQRDLLLRDDAIYDLTGRRLTGPEEMQPGKLYIHAGRKTMRVE